MTLRLACSPPLPDSEQIADLAQSVHRHFQEAHISSIPANTACDTLASDPKLAAVVRALDRLSRYFALTRFGALLERRESPIVNSHQIQILLPANSIECGRIPAAQFRNRAPEMRPRLVV